MHIVNAPGFPALVFLLESCVTVPQYVGSMSPATNVKITRSSSFAPLSPVGISVNLAGAYGLVFSPVAERGGPPERYLYSMDFILDMNGSVLHVLI